MERKQSRTIRHDIFARQVHWSAPQNMLQLLHIVTCAVKELLVFRARRAYTKPRPPPNRIICTNEFMLRVRPRRRHSHTFHPRRHTRCLFADSSPRGYSLARTLFFTSSQQAHAAHRSQRRRANSRTDAVTTTARRRDTMQRKTLTCQCVTNHCS
jgi:hypothetical protein